MSVGYAELIEKVYPQGEIGKYLVDQLLEHNANTRPEMEYRSLGDSPCIGIIMDPECGRFSWRPAPTFDPQMHYLHSGQYRPIRVYKDVKYAFHPRGPLRQDGTVHPARVKKLRPVRSHNWPTFL